MVVDISSFGAPEKESFDFASQEFSVVARSLGREDEVLVVLCDFCEEFEDTEYAGILVVPESDEVLVVSGLACISISSSFCYRGIVMFLVQTLREL